MRISTPIKTLLSLICFLSVCPLWAGSGKIWTAGPKMGQIDFTVKFTYPPPQEDIDDLNAALLAASDILCDVTDGQMRFGTITLVGGTMVDNDLADMVVIQNTGRSNASLCDMGFGVDCNALEQEGARIRLYHDDINDAYTIAHEFGHLALDLGDEYDEQQRQGACWGIGVCIECEDVDATNTCLMQQGMCTFPDWSEACVAQNHDPIQGDPNLPACADPDDLACNIPCPTNCQFYNPDTCRYELSYQSAWSFTKYGTILDCWSHMANTHAFLNPPAGTPDPNPPACGAPSIINNVEAADQVVLVMDTSGSMNYGAKTGYCEGAVCPELCGNGVDDDGDGLVDEEPCETTRLDFLKSAALAFLNLHKASGTIFDPVTTDAGLVKFNCTPTSLDPELIGVSANRYNNFFLPTVNGLTAGGKTAIGDALVHAAGLFPGGDDASSKKAVLLITDGYQNCGAFSPEDAAAQLEAEDIRMYLVSTGSASNDEVLGQLADQTNGKQVHSDSPQLLVTSMVNQWANHTSAGLQIPRLQFEVMTGSPFSEPAMRSIDSYYKDEINPTSGSLPYETNRFRITAEEGTSRLVIALAGAMTNMGDYAVRGVLDGPAGVNPNHYDSDGAVQPPQMEIVREGFYTLLMLSDPNPGTWYLEVSAAGQPGIATTGNVTVALENRRTELYTNLDRRMVDLGDKDPVRLTVWPAFDTQLRDALVSARVRWPDGSWHDLKVLDNSDANAGYLAQIKQFPYVGKYEIRVRLKTRPGLTTNHPGETMGDPASAPNSVAVPYLERTVTNFFYVKRSRTTSTR